MTKYQKETLRYSLEEEKKILNTLKRDYKEAGKTIEARIKKLMGREDADLPHVIHQVKYQKALRSQIDDVLDKLNDGTYSTIQKYMEDSYGTGFTSSLYRLQKQGVPLIFPMNRNEILRAVQTNSKISKKKYGKNFTKMKNTIRNEVTRGISSSMSFGDIARNIDNRMKVGLNASYRVARTEGHRINQEASFDAMHKAKEAGADVVKKWDSTLDSRTRPHHSQLDGQIKELDEPFEVAGKQAMYPSGFGRPEEDINCRCVVLEVGRWELDEDEDFTKIGNEDSAIYEIKSDSYQSFKENYYKQIDDYNNASKILGKNAPVTFRDYIDIQNSDDKNLFDHYLEAIEKKELTSFADFNLYKAINNEIDEKLIGVTAIDGLKIENKSYHFISRVIGSISQKRSGVTVDECLEVLKKSEDTKDVIDKDGRLSRKYSYNECEVSVNPENGNLIQCNPRRKRKKKDDSNK